MVFVGKNWEYFVLSMGLTMWLGCQEKAQISGKESGVSKNSPPSINSITIDPSQPHVMDLLKSEATAVDPDGDSMTYSYQWMKNGAEMYGEVSATLSPGKARKGDSISVRVIPFDGKDYGEARVSDPVIILNSPPMMRSAKILPERPTKAQELIAQGEAEDPDGDKVTFLYQWVKNGTEIEGERASTLKNTQFRKGDTIGVVITCMDEENAEGNSASDTVLIQNSPPRIISTPPNVPLGKGGLYTYQVVAEDADKDVLSYSLTRFPPGMSIDSKTGLIQWMASEKDSGTHDVEVIVEDGDGGKATQKYSLTLSFPEAQK